MFSEVPGEIIAAAVGWALPENREKAGVIMEVHDRPLRDRRPVGLALS
jgi:pyruvoyl-dependent arginine decarboxylase (PvlArgDC)